MSGSRFFIILRLEVKDDDEEILLQFEKNVCGFEWTTRQSTLVKRLQTILGVFQAEQTFTMWSLYSDKKYRICMEITKLFPR